MSLMGVSENLTAANTKELVAQSKRTNELLAAILAELQKMNAPSQPWNATGITQT